MSVCQVSEAKTIHLAAMNRCDAGWRYAYLSLMAQHCETLHSRPHPQPESSQDLEQLILAIGEYIDGHNQNQKPGDGDTSGPLSARDDLT